MTANPDGAPRSGTASIVLAALVAAPTLAACAGSSSSSPAAKASASASAAASAIASKFGITPTQSAPGSFGPAGNITAPATQAPNPTSPGGSEVFPNVPAQLDHRIYLKLGKLQGVRSSAYYPQFKQLQVYFTAGATDADRRRVYRFVIRHDPAAAGSPSSSPAPTPTPSASAS